MKTERQVLLRRPTIRRSLGGMLAVAALAASAAVALAGPANLTGAVKTPLALDQATLAALPPTTITISFQTGNGPETGTYTGVLLWDLLEKAELVNAEGKNTILRHALTITGSDGYAVAVAEGEFDPKFGNRQVLIAYEGGDGKASYDHLRLLVPGDLHGGRAVSDVVSIEVK
jgi:hypothetical protein